jgi:rRNA maturation protein Nop10
MRIMLRFFILQQSLNRSPLHKQGVFFDTMEEGEVRGMALEMRENCERCGEKIDWESEVFICSYECTFCISCTEEMRNICPNCGGELVPRPKRK